MTQNSARPSRRAVATTLTTCAALAASLSTGQAHADDTQTLPTVSVTSRGKNMMGVADAASEGTVAAEQLANRPLLRPAEVMETVPGMIVTQHSGDGKANQYFLRGFNLDHGSDFATSVMGMPVNMVTHGHGQGYMDLNFLIPELVRSLRYRKGMYAAEDGDFATTGSAHIDYQRQLAAPFAEVTFGAHDYRRALLAGSRHVTRDGESPTVLAALELATNDGPWDQPENLRKANGVLRLSDGTLRDGYALTAMAYRASWTATEHVPLRAIESGEIGRYGALTPSDGGDTHRVSLSAEWARSQGEGQTRAHAYAIDYGLNLFSNPSGFINGPQGDQHEQADHRQVFGGEAARSWILGLGGRETEATLGVQLRHDRIGTLGLYDTVARERTDTVREDRVRQTMLGIYGEAKTQWSPWLRSMAGLRLDEVRARVTPTGGDNNMANGGSVQGHQVSPKLGVVLGPFDTLGKSEFYANWGRGFHSNDLRGATSTVNPSDGSAIDKVPPLVHATGSEVGLRALPLPGWNTSLTLWQMNLGSELVFIGDAGVTEPKGASRRVGLEWSNDWQVNRWLLIDGDVAWSRARFREAVDGAGTHVPNAIPLTASLAIAADDHGQWYGGLRWRYIGSYALEETGTQKSASSWTANLKVGYRATPRLQFTLDVLNLFDRQANDIEYWGGACTRTDGPGCNGGEGIDGRLVHPMEPRTLRLSMRASF